MSESQRLKAYAKLIRGLIMVASAIWEMTTGREAPNWSNVLRAG
jgi:hypothetical protein